MDARVGTAATACLRVARFVDAAPHIHLLVHVDTLEVEVEKLRQSAHLPNQESRELAPIRAGHLMIRRGARSSVWMARAYVHAVAA